MKTIKYIILTLLSLGALASLISICTSIDDYHTLVSCVMFMLFSGTSSCILLADITSKA